MSIKR